MLQHNQPAKLWTTSFISLTLCSLLLFLNLQMLLSSFPAYVKEEFQAGDLMVSLVTSLFALSAIMTRFMTAALMKRISRGTLLYAGLVIAGAVTAVYTFAGGMGSLLAMRILYGVGFGISSTIIPTLVSQIIPGNRMGEGIGYFGLSTSLAMSIGPVVGMNIMNQYGFGALTIAGTIVVLLAVPLLFASRAVSAGKKPAAEGRAGLVSAAAGKQKEEKRPAFNLQLVFPALLNMIVAITYSGLLSFIVLFGQSVKLEQVGLFFLFNVITIVIIRPISGRIFDSKGHGAVLIPAALCIIASMVVLSFTTTLPMLVVSALLYGLGFGAIQPTIQAWMLRTCPVEQHGTANSMYYNSTDLGVAAGAILLGAISSATSYATMYLYSAGIMVVFLLVYFIARQLLNRKQPAGSAGQAGLDNKKMESSL